MRFDILTLFPEMFSPLNESILKRAQEKNLLELYLHNIRDYSKNKHKKVDDTPYGGGAGMLMTCQPLFDCIEDVKKQIQESHEENKKEEAYTKPYVIFMTPKGKTLTQNRAEELAKYKNLILLCGHYEGIDHRVREALVDEEISIGEYVLTGGELPAMVLIDTVSRLIPDVLGKEASHQEESYSKALGGKREYPHYTKPAEFRGMKVPEVLLNGNHKLIEEWRKNNCS